MVRSIRVPVRGLGSGELRLDPNSATYVVRVHRLRAGDSFVAFDPAARVEGDAELLRLDPPAPPLVRVAALRPARVTALREVTWIQGLPKGDKMDAIVRDLTELGATRIVPVATIFAVTKLSGERGEQRRQRWQRIADEAARQCGRGDAPDVEGVTSWADAVVRALPGARFCLHEKATVPIGPRLGDALGDERSLTFASGPEGGLSDDEVALAVAEGFVAVTLGAFVLRAETVAAAVMGAVRIVSGDGTTTAVTPPE